MARVKKSATRERKPRAPRGGPKPTAPEADGNIEWVIQIATVVQAEKILNRHKERPYWASIDWEGGNPPVAGVLPCTMFRSGDKVYYGFLFRHHREHFILTHTDARRVLTDAIRGLTPKA